MGLFGNKSTERYWIHLAIAITRKNFNVIIHQIYSICVRFSLTRKNRTLIERIKRI